MASCVTSQGFPVSRRKVTEAQPRETRREQGARQPPVSGEPSAPPPPAPTQSGGLPKPSAPLPGSPWKPAVPPEEPEEEESAKCPRCARRPGALPSARPRFPAPPAPPARGRAAPARPARGVSPGPAPARPPASSTSSGPGAPPPWSEGSQPQGSPEPAAMDAVLEPFPADRLFPGSSFLDLGDLNESDFLNNAVRRRVCAPLPHSAPLCAARPPPRRGYTSLGRAEEGGWSRGPRGARAESSGFGGEVPQHLPVPAPGPEPQSSRQDAPLLGAPSVNTLASASRGRGRRGVGATRLPDVSLKGTNPAPARGSRTRLRAKWTRGWFSAGRRTG